MRFIIKISPESIVKSRSVRKWHFKRLQRNIYKVLKMMDFKIEIFVFSDRLEMECDNAIATACQDRLRCIPGIHSILRVDILSLPDSSQASSQDSISDIDPVEFIANKALHYYSKAIEGKSFAVRCKRIGKHAFSSLDIQRQVGSSLFMNSNNSTVNLKQPDLTISIEIKDENVYFIHNKKMGLGGYPIGTQGSVLSLISGGYDSSVASYQMMRRGCRTNFLFFNLGGTAHSIGAQQAALFLWSKYGCSHNAIFHTISLDSFVTELMQLPDKSLNGVLLKRAMLKVGELVAKKYKIQTLVTGESLAQVSSQTLANLSVIDKATDHLILRPLIATDKRDIIDTAEQIGSAIFAQNMVEYCGVISDKPNVAASLKDLNEIEDSFGHQWFYDALDSAQKTDVSDIIDNLTEQPQIEFVKNIDGQIVIDIRATAKPIAEANLHIHFYKLKQQFPSLAQDKQYLLFCDKGVMSQLHAAYLQEQGFDNVKVYRPE